MSDGTPLVTLVKAREIDARPMLTKRDEALEQTLTMLCSFLSTEDLVSFLASSGFRELARQASPWLVFELGLYKDHTKTLQLVPEAAHITLADAAMTGVLDDHVWHGQPDAAMATLLEAWVATVANRSVQ